MTYASTRDSEQLRILNRPIGAFIGRYNAKSRDDRAQDAVPAARRHGLAAVPGNGGI